MTPNADRELLVVAVARRAGRRDRVRAEAAGRLVRAAAVLAAGRRDRAERAARGAGLAAAGAYPLTVRVYSRDLARAGLSEPGHLGPATGAPARRACARERGGRAVSTATAQHAAASVTTWQSPSRSNSSRLRRSGDARGGAGGGRALPAAVPWARCRTACSWTRRRAGTTPTPCCCTGADQYGVRWPLFAEGLDDYTPTLYTLLVVPSVAALGLTEVAVRLPAALAGIADGRARPTCAAGRCSGGAAGLVAAALVAISPWHILPSRTGAEWVLLPLFMTTGVWLLARGRTHGPSLLLAGMTLGVGLYSYAFARLLVPLLVVGFAALWWRELRRALALGAGRRCSCSPRCAVPIVVVRADAGRAGPTPDGGAARAVPRAGADPVRAGELRVVLRPVVPDLGQPSRPTTTAWPASGRSCWVMVPLIVAGLAAVAARPIAGGAVLPLVDRRGAGQRRAAPREPVVGAAARGDPGLAPALWARRRAALWAGHRAGGRGIALATTALLLAAGVRDGRPRGASAVRRLPGLRRRRLAVRRARDDRVPGGARATSTTTCW